MSYLCRVCQGSDLGHFSRQDAKSAQPLKLMLCHACSLVQVSDLPDAIELHRYYSDAYREDYKQVHTPAAKYIARAAQAACDRLGWIRPHWPNRSPVSIDIGSGGGEFVYLSAKAGCHSRGFEPHQGYSSFAREAYDVEVQTGGIDQLEAASADVITLFHVLEHLRDPLQVVAQLHRALRPNGILAIEVPNSLQADASPHNIYFSAHLYYYNALSLDRLLGTHFKRVWFQDRGNLCVIYRRLDTPQALTAIDAHELQQALNTFKSRGWLSYLTEGRAWAKPWRRIQQRRFERQFNALSPRSILDQIFAASPPGESSHRA